MAGIVEFEEKRIIEFLDSMSDGDLDALDFGVVRMTYQGEVTAYNKAEAELSGMKSELVLGKNFFVQVAPCTNNYMVAERFGNAEELDEVIDYVFTYAMVPTPVTLRMVKSASSESQYLLVRPQKRS
ncbi:MAG: photoactive yellow protein [Spirochaetes bacterium]|jgi:photoactive yellow protein|nr:photoactive yellow protein [Spirochaetota bacterium]